jgi:hypothetical protein
MYQSTRRVLLNILEEKTYIRLARWYNDVLATIKERSYVAGNPNSNFSTELPLIYISQPPRCGGTLTRNLLDGHPELDVYPYELSWEKNGYHWESGLLNDAKSFRLLQDKWISHAINHGVDKKISFHFNRQTHKHHFINGEGQNTRATLGSYLAAFFRAWSNYQNNSPVKKYYAAFCPWTTVNAEWAARFFNIYPDGFRIHIIRDPFAWWASEKMYNKRRIKVIEDYLYPHWIQSSKEGIRLHETYQGKYILVNYEQLIRNTKASMQAICDAIGINFHDALMVPMLNGCPRESNTSHDAGVATINNASLNKWKSVLNKAEIELITEEAKKIYDKAISLSINQP